LRNEAVASDRTIDTINTVRKQIDNTMKK